MSTELELLRAFRAQDAAVDAGSAEAARLALLAHIAAEPGDLAPEGIRARPHRRAGFFARFRADAIALALAILVVVGVGAVFLGVGGRHPRAVRPAITPATGPPAIRNIAPARVPALPGQIVCNADLARPGVTPGVGGSPSGVIEVSATVVHGVNESPFSVTATGLAPNTASEGYAVWILPAVSLTSGGYQLIAGVHPRLLGVITPGVGRTGKLAASGLLPSDVQGAYLVEITRQPRAALRAPGRPVLEGFAAL